MASIPEEIAEPEPPDLTEHTAGYFACLDANTLGEINRDSLVEVFIECYSRFLIRRCEMVGVYTWSAESVGFKETSMSQTMIFSPGSSVDVVQNAHNPNLFTDLIASGLRFGRDQLARSLGLPGMGARLTNVHGMEWRVVGHTHAASPVSVKSNGGQMVLDDPQDLVPIIGPEKLSPRLDTFFREVNLCTSKGFLFLDTVPEVRTNRANPYGQSVNDTDNPDCIVFMLDAANVSETILAHELGHVWLRLVEDSEYDYHLKDVTYPAKVRMINYVQSFVLDRRVNEVIEERGFDVSCIRDDQQGAIVNFALAVSLGHLPPYCFESVFTALVIANQILDDGMPVKDQPSEASCSMQPVDEPHKVLDKVLDLMDVQRERIPEIYELAEAFAASVRRNGYRGRDAIARSIEECLQLAFGFAGIDFDVARDFRLVPFVEPMTDKFPEFLTGFLVAAKLEAGGVMADKNLPWPLQYALHTTPHGYTAISFLDGQEQWTSPVVLRHRPRHPEFDLADLQVPQLPSSHHVPQYPYARLSAHVRSMLGVPGQQTNRASATNRQGLPALPAVPGPYDHLPEQPRAMMPPLPGQPHRGSSGWAPGEQLTHLRGNPTSPFALPVPPSFRSYMAGEGRWLSQARLEEQLQGEWAYAYADNNPVVLIDPEGLRPRPGDPEYDPYYDTYRGGPPPIRPWPKMPPRYAPPTVSPVASGGIPAVYGNYCGPQTKPSFAKPIDALDSCCQVHDNCFGLHQCNVCNQYTSIRCITCNYNPCTCVTNMKCKTAACSAMKVIVIAYACSAANVFGRGGGLPTFGKPY